MKLYATVSTFIMLLISCSLCFAQSSASTLVLCLNKSTQKLSVKASCTSSETLVSGKNLSTTATSANPTPTPVAPSSINLTGCYSTSAKRGASTFDGRVAVGVMCKQKTDLLINDQVTNIDTSGAKPAVESKQLVVKGKIPNGVEYGMIATGSTKKFYTVQVTAICCPTVTTQ